MHRFLYQIPLNAVILWIIVLAGIPSSAMESLWQEVPEHLKSQEGVIWKERYVFATARVRAENIRKDKAHELARKKSLLKALRLVHISFSCRAIIDELNPREQEVFVREFSILAPDIRLQGLTVVRQWEKDFFYYATVAVPANAGVSTTCQFSDLTTIISHYVENNRVSLEGLAFCLRHVHRYTNLNRNIREKIGKLYQRRGIQVLAQCFIYHQNSSTHFTPFFDISLQNRLARSAELTEKATFFATNGQWYPALDLIDKALNLTPSFSRAYLVLADYFIQKEKKPEFAVHAVRKAFRDGVHFKKALPRLIECLNALNSQEVEVFQYLLSKCPENSDKKPALNNWPVSWRENLEILENTRVPYLVLASAGNVVEGESQQPGPLFDQAVESFRKSESDDDLIRSLTLLFEACEKQPAAPEIYNLIGACYRHLGRPVVAFPFFWQALSLDPEYDYALTNLGICCRKLGLMKSAGYYFEQDAVKSSKNSWVREEYAKYRTSTK